MYIMILKNVLKITFILFILLFLGACGSSDQITYKEPIQEKNGQDITLKKASGIYLGMLNKGSFEIKTNEGKRIVSFVNDISPIVENIKSDSEIEISYDENNGDIFIVHSIKVVNEPGKNSDEKEQKEEKNNENKDLLMSNQGYKIKILDNFTFSTGIVDIVSNKENNEAYLKIQIIDKHKDIKKYRWEAAADLKNTGELKELKNENIPSIFINSEFVFHTEDEHLTKIIAVKQIGEERFRFKLVYPKSNKPTNLEFDFETIISTISF